MTCRAASQVAKPERMRAAQLADLAAAATDVAEAHHYALQAGMAAYREGVALAANPFDAGDRRATWHWSWGVAQRAARDRAAELKTGADPPAGDDAAAAARAGRLPYRDD